MCIYMICIWYVCVHVHVVYVCICDMICIPPLMMISTPLVTIESWDSQRKPLALESPNLLRICVTLLLPPWCVYGVGVFVKINISQPFFPHPYMNSIQLFVEIWSRFHIKQPSRNLHQKPERKKPSVSRLQPYADFPTDLYNIPLSTSLYTFSYLTTSDILCFESVTCGNLHQKNDSNWNSQQNCNLVSPTLGATRHVLSSVRGVELVLGGTVCFCQQFVFGTVFL